MEDPFETYKVKLNIGEEISMRGLPRTLQRIKLDNSLELLEVYGLNGGTGWVENSPNYIQSGGRFYYRMSKVFICLPSDFPHSLKANLQTPVGQLPSVQDAAERTIKEYYRKVGIPPYINGFLINESIKEDLKEPVGGGHDHVTTGHKAALEVKLFRYVPATPENRKKLTDVFGEVL